MHLYCERNCFNVLLVTFPRILFYIGFNMVDLFTFKGLLFKSAMTSACFYLFA